MVILEKSDFKDFERILQGLQRVVYILVNNDYDVSEICSMLSINKRTYHRIWKKIESHWRRYYEDTK